MNTFELSLDLDKRSTFQGITIRRGDSDGTTVRASIFDHGSVANLTGATAYLVIRLPDGEHYYRKAATVGTGIVTTTINEAEAASVVGSTKLAYFEISQGGSEYSTSSFAVKVLNDAVAGMNPPESYDDEIAQLVDDWLVAHPEATTTVQDGSITTAKIADNAITTAKLAANAVTTAKIANANVTTAKVADGAITHDKLAEVVTDVIDSVPTIQRNVDRLLGNVLIGELADGTVLTADDAYSAPPKSVEVYGKSVQNGTPTPDAPVPILSVDALTLHASADGTTDYTNWPVQIPLSNHVGRSLPDGTEDLLTLTYQGPSEREGWGVYSKTLVQKVGVSTINASEWQNKNAVSIGDGWYRTVNDVLSGAESVTGATATQGMCTAAPFVFNTTLKSEHVGTQGIYMLIVAQESTAAAIAAKYDGATVIYKLKNPVTHDLGTVELPVNPAPDLTAWADGGSAQPTMQLEYERDVNIALVMERDKAMAEIAPLETSPTKANHSVGTYLMYDGTLYKVTQAIASGEQITPGTNVTATTVAAELLALA